MLNSAKNASSKVIASTSAAPVEPSAKVAPAAPKVTPAPAKPAAVTPEVKALVWQRLGDNLEFAIEGKQVLLRFNIDERLGDSASGKTTLVSSTRGNMTIPGVPGGVVAGINIYVKK